MAKEESRAVYPALTLRPSAGTFDSGSYRALGGVIERPFDSKVYGITGFELVMIIIRDSQYILFRVTGFVSLIQNSSVSNCGQ